METLVRPETQTLCEWMDKQHIEWFECDSCQALHLPAMQNFDGVFDAKLDIADNVILFTARAEVRPSALLSLAGELSHINASSLTAKAFLDVQDETIPKLIVCQSLNIECGITRSQFVYFMQQSEAQASMIIMEAFASNMLVVADDSDTSQPLLRQAVLH
ncbi:YbjN domain-containing protein [Tatumella citrea]|uniref:Sensory transduction regulator n=1 Tax=Tatumella citrea TaxID=53336 RepID=A0A1Y0LHG2_TATCI|nr:YbjN domain-containing protein [Tatumella citrea]ARU93485.1 sensory transduction regulator [Tatumella citrea]ARU97524.1 sensory transduction regulator [Tatumella citrea]